jgi:hypothetical protein
VSALFWTRGGGGDRGARYAPLSLSTRSTITTSCLPMRSSLLMERMRRRDSSVIKIIPSTSLYSSSLTYAPISSMLFTCTAKVCGWQSSKGAPSQITAWERQFWGGGWGRGWLTTATTRSSTSGYSFWYMRHPARSILHAGAARQRPLRTTRCPLPGLPRQSELRGIEGNRSSGIAVRQSTAVNIG